MAGIDLQLNLGGDYNDSSGIAVEKGDFLLRNGKFSLVADDNLGYQVGQRLHVRLNLYRGEVFFNTSAGFPYLDISKFKKSTGIFDSYMKTYIVQTDGVSKLSGYSSGDNAATDEPILDQNGKQIGTKDSLYYRRLRMHPVRFDVLINDGQTLNISQELEV